MSIREVVKKTRIFYGQADRKGGEQVNLPLPDCKHLWKKLHFFTIEYDSLILKTHFT